MRLLFTAALLLVVAGCGGGSSIEVHGRPTRRLGRNGSLLVRVEGYGESRRDREQALEVEGAIASEIARRALFALVLTTHHQDADPDVCVDVRLTNTFFGGVFYQVEHAAEVTVTDVRAREAIVSFRAEGASSHEPFADRTEQAIQANERMARGIADELERLSR